MFEWHGNNKELGLLKPVVPQQYLRCVLCEQLLEVHLPNLAHFNLASNAYWRNKNHITVTSNNIINSIKMTLTCYMENSPF